MKKMISITAGLLILTSCATSKVEESSINESKSEKNLIQQTKIKQAVEMRRFILKFDRLYISRGGRIDLVPMNNYFILDGDKAIINAAYVGTQYNYKPIAAINMIGRTVDFEMKDNSSKGVYEIRMKVKNENNSFDVYISINNKGYCNASITNYQLDRVRYTGTFIPFKVKEDSISNENTLI
jgi:hypothetical protein